MDKKNGHIIVKSENFIYLVYKNPKTKFHEKI